MCGKGCFLGYFASLRRSCRFLRSIADRKCDVSGQQCDVSGQQCGVSGQQCGVSGQQCGTSGQQCGTSGQQCGTSGQQCGTSGQQCGTSGQQCGTSGQQCGTSGQQCGGEKIHSVALERSHIHLFQYPGGSSGRGFTGFRSCTSRFTEQLFPPALHAQHREQFLQAVHFSA
jgi:hypothetical protein